MSQTDRRQRKSTLFCPGCSYESPAPTGWLEYTLSGRRHRRCPACFTLVDRRPTDERAVDWPDGREQVRSGFAVWRASVTRWQESVERLGGLHG